MTNNRKFLSLSRAVVVAALAITPALAVNVTYNTTGTFVGGGGSGNVLTGPGGLIITYTPVTGGLVTPPYPSNAQFGLFTVVGPLTGQDLVSSDFTLRVTETGPGSGTEELDDTYAGTIQLSSSQVKLTFTGGSGAGGVPVLSSDPITGAPAYTFTIGDVVYWVDKVTPINPSTTGGGVSSINGAISASAVPEPTFYGLTGLGFTGLLAMAIRRRLQGLS